MEFAEVMSALEMMGNEQTKKVLTKHGAKEPFFGVKVADLKKIVKKVKKDHNLALKLYATGNSDAMYLAGLIADENAITKEELQNWVENAYWYYLAEYAVPWVAADSPHGWEMALKWIESDVETIASAGWGTLSSLVTITKDEDLDLQVLNDLLERVAKNIHQSPNRVRHTMNGFVIAAGGTVKPLTNKAIEIGKKNGKISVDMGGTACKVPSAPEYIEKMINSGRHGNKKKVARC